MVQGERTPASVEYVKTSASFNSLEKFNTPVFLLGAPFSTDFVFKLGLHPYWTRHFQQNMVISAKLHTPSFLLVAPFSLDSIFKTCDPNLDMRFVLTLNYKHVSTAGLTV
jgi:hypothetical protein